MQKYMFHNQKFLFRIFIKCELTMRQKSRTKSFLMKPRRYCFSGRDGDVENVIYFVSESTRSFAVTSMSSIYWHLIQFVSRTSHIINVTLQGKPFSPLLIVRQITCPNIAAAYFRATYYIHLMNSTCIAERADAVCVRRLIFHLAHWDLFFFLFFEYRGLGWGRWISQPAGQPARPASSLLCLQRPCQPAVDPFTFRRPVAFRHPLRRPLKWCLLQCTVGVNHTPRERRVEFHTMGPPTSVVWGFRGRIRD